MAVLAVLGVVASCLGPAMEIGKLIAPIRRQCSYLCCFSSNIKTLEAEAKILDDVTSDLQGKIDQATNDARPIYSQVETWLKDSVKAKTETKEIVDGAPNVESGCLKLGKRYSLSKKAKKTTIAIKLLVEKCKFTEISHPPPAAATVPVEFGTTSYEFESRRQIEEEIVKSLGDENANMIGIGGMGGLGKTYIAQKMMNRALKERLFDEVGMAVVSQPVDKLNIQLQIAGPLDLKFKDDVLISRANLLRDRLRGNKRTLLILDDVWGSIDLVELGIPCENGCRVLITSRDNGVFTRMDVKKVFLLEILDEKESWDLFKGNAGTCVDDTVLNPIAEDVMRECKGLPLALVVVAKALKDENEVSIWEDALGQLRRSNPADIPDIIEQVYNPLKLSYDRLGNQNKNAKSLFLLCCLFPEDHNIPLEHLVYFATGLHLFQDIGELKQVRGRTRALIKMLKTRGLLLDGKDKDGKDKDHVRMHDVVRDVAVFIASKERQVKCSNPTWISSHVDGGFRLNNVSPPHESSFPKLKLLLMNNQVKEEQEVDELIGGSPELSILFIEHHGSLKSVPRIISLTSLVLYGCESLENMAAVGQMKSLEILVCYRCRSIKELPEQVRGLKRLRLLKITRCLGFGRLAAGVISSLVGLEELKIVDGFDEWNGGDIDEGEGGREASLSEIESLKKMRCLDIEVSDVALAAQPLRLSPESLVQFRVQFGKPIHINDDNDFPNRSYERRMSLDFGDEDGMIKCGNIFLTRTECLYACGTQDFELNLASAQSIRWLTLKGFWNRKNITSAAVAFPLLEYLSLTHLLRLEEVWDAPIPSHSFTNLKHLNLDNLWRLKHLGKCVLSTIKVFFLQPETIEIKACGEIEHLLVLMPNDNEDDITLLFPKLKILRVYVNCQS